MTSQVLFGFNVVWVYARYRRFFAKCKVGQSEGCVVALSGSNEGVCVLLLVFCDRAVGARSGQLGRFRRPRGGEMYDRESSRPNSPRGGSRRSSCTMSLRLMRLGN